MSETMDLRSTMPDWWRYAIYVGGSSNKFYEARVDLLDDGTWQLSFRYGRRPDIGSGSIKTSTHPSMAIACALANSQIPPRSTRATTRSSAPTRQTPWSPATTTSRGTETRPAQAGTARLARAGLAKRH